MTQGPQHKLALMTATATIVVVVALLSAVALWAVALQQAEIENKASRIYDVAMPKTFEATRVVRGLERLARDGEAILWVATADERDERRLRLQTVRDDSALQGTPEIREQVASALAVLDANLAEMRSNGVSARAAAETRWEPVAQSLLNLGVQLGAEAVDSALAESDGIFGAVQAARRSLLLAMAVIALALLVATGLIFLVFARPLKRLAASLRLAGEGQAMSEGSEAIHELQVLHDAAVALARSHQQLATMRSQLDRLAHTDDLTGLANRRMFQERAAQMLELAKRYGDPCSIIVFDLDHFKTINDRFGHEGGDLILRFLGQYLRDMARTVDLVARVGGEEFAVVLPHTGLPVAQMAAIRICDGIAAQRTTMPNAQVLAFTASFGVAQYHRSDNDLAAFMHRADQALYRAKAGGRNRVEVAD